MVRTLDYGSGQVARALLSDRYRAAEPSVVVDSQTEPPAALFGEIVLDGRVVDAFASAFVQYDSLYDGVSECYAFLHVQNCFTGAKVASVSKSGKEVLCGTKKCDKNILSGIKIVYL